MKFQSDEPLAQDLLDTVERGQDVGLAMMDGDGVLKVGTRLAVSGAGGPSVALGNDVLAAHIDHGLDGNRHSVAQQRSCSTSSEVGNLGILVQLAPYPMSAHLAHDTVVVTLAILLDGMGDVTDAVAGHGVLDTDIE